VTLSGITKVYPGGVRVLSGFDLHVRSGELLALLGPSGSGKSTILRLIAGLEAPTDGRVLFDGEDFTAVTTRDRNVAMVQQDGALYTHLSARDNIRFPLVSRNVPKEDRDREIETEAKQLGILALLDKMPGQLSAGHRHTVATARALVRDARVLLMDEPLAMLDTQVRSQTRTEVARLHQELGTTIVYVTNDHREAMALGDRVAVLDGGGGLCQVGPPRDVYRHPSSLFVADFVGEMNSTIVRVEGSGTEAWLPLGNDRFIPSAGEHRPVLARLTGQEVVVGIRPEHLSLASPGAPFESCLHGTVERVEDVGSHATVHAVVGDWPVKARLTSGHLPTPGNMIELAVASEHLHFFDPDRGDRL
jgi:multiple sugar transport system ATP-binding protein